MINARHTRRPRPLAGCVRWTPVALVTLLSLGLAGCDEDDPSPVACSCSAATLSGSLLNDAGPVAGLVWARSTNWQANPYYTQVETDPDGSFELKVPAGSYCLQATDPSWWLFSGTRCYYSAQGPVLSEGEADTLAISAGESRTDLDFRFGRVELAAQAPAGLEGRRVTLLLEPAGVSTAEGTGWAYEHHGRIEGGAATAAWPAVAPGTYRGVLVLLSESGVPSERVRLLAGPEEDPHSDRLMVESTALVSHAAHLPDPPAQLSGTLAGAWRNLGFGGASLSVVAADSSLALDGAWLSEGPFRLELHGAGTVRLKVRIDDVERWLGGADFAHASQFELRAGTVVEGITIADCGLRVGLTGYGEHPESPESGVYLTLHARADGAFVGRTYGTSPVQGIANLTPGEYLLRVESAAEPFSSAWIPQWYDRGTSMASASPIVLAEPGDIAQVTVRLQPGGVIQGVVDRPVLPARVGGWGVVATTAQDPDTLGTLRISADCYGFALQGLPDGDYRVGAWVGSNTYPFEPTGFAWYPGTPDWEAASVISIRDAGTVSGIDFALPR